MDTGDAGLFIFAGVTNLVQSWIAWDQGQQSMVGHVFDTLATKGELFGKCFYSDLLLSVPYPLVFRDTD